MKKVIYLLGIMLLFAGVAKAQDAKVQNGPQIEFEKLVHDYVMCLTTAMANVNSVSPIPVTSLFLCKNPSQAAAAPFLHGPKSLSFLESLKLSK